MKSADDTKPTATVDELKEMLALAISLRDDFAAAMDQCGPLTPEERAAEEKIIDRMLSEAGC